MMICNHNAQYIIIVLLLAIQYPFQTDFFTKLLPTFQAGWTKNKVTNFQIQVAKYILNFAAMITCVLCMFIYYKVKKRRLMLSISFIINAIVFLAYLGINEDRFWIAILVRLCNGVFLGMFHSITASYLYYFAPGHYPGFYGYLIQTVMFLGLVILGLLLSALNWKYIAIILAGQDLVCACLIWILPEVLPPSKFITRDYIYQRQHYYSLFIVIMLMLLQQFSGIGIVINNVPKLLQGIGLEIESHLQTALMNTVGCLTTFIGAFASVIVPRKYMWGLSAFGLALALIIYGITMKVPTPHWVGTLGIFLFFMFYGFGEGPITWFLSGELFPDSVRIESGSINVFLNQALGLIFSFVNQEIEKRTGEFGAIICSVAMDVVAMLFGVIFIPSTRATNYENDNLL